MYVLFQAMIFVVVETRALPQLVSHDGLAEKGHYEFFLLMWCAEVTERLLWVE